MSEKESRPFRVRARGPVACFTRPEMKVERVSYEVMTPAAARGLLDAVLWKPAIRWRVHEIAVLAPIAWISFRRNEVNERAIAGKHDYFADEDRAQRNTVALRDVDYLITASFEIVPAKAGAEDSVRKFEEMFQRRLEKGQQFHAPYFGCREFPASLEAASGEVRAIDQGIDRPLGLMFFDFDYDGGPTPKPMFFHARLESGVLKVPDRAAVVRENGPLP